MRKAIVALSGGVDSSVAAALLLDAGFDVTGVTLGLGDVAREPFPGEEIRQTESYVSESTAVARHLGINHIVVDARREFRRHVIDPSIGAYQRGLTPNPCLYCNNTIKFGLLGKVAAEHNAILATGHYARIRRTTDGSYQLCRATDRSKDQSYLLVHLLEDNRLEGIRFPLGEMSKSEVRRVAEQRGFPSATRGESQDICFPLKSLIPAIPGRIINEKGEMLGHHTGINRFTIGQRQGLGIASADRLYVVAIRPDTNEIVVGPDDVLFRRSATIEPCIWSNTHRRDRYRVMGKIRYNHTAAPAVISTHGTSLKIIFDEPQRAITPGQVCACYIDDCVVAGGIIRSAGDSP